MFILKNTLTGIDSELTIEENDTGFIVSGNQEIQNICQRFLEQGYLVILCGGGAIFPKSVWDDEYKAPIQQEIKRVSLLEKILNFVNFS